MKQGQVRKIVITGMLTALAVVLMQIQIPFLTPYLRLDVSDTPALIGTFILGPVAGVTITFLKNLIDFSFNASETGIPIGHIANFAAALLLILPTYYIYQFKKTFKQLVIAGIIGILVTTTFMALLNYFYFLPLYAKFLGLDPNRFGDLMKEIVKFILPFNLVKGALQISVICLIYPRIEKLIKRKS